MSVSSAPVPKRAGRLRVAIYAGLSGDGRAGGVEQFVMSLVHGLGKLADGDEEYVIVTRRMAGDWLDAYLGPNQRVVQFAERMPERWLDALGPVRPIAEKAAAAVLRQASRWTPAPTSLPASHNLFETLGAHVVHFPYQRMLATSVPSIYNPHDLQHRHFPEFFSRQQLAWREYHYGAACTAAAVVAVASNWIKRDIVAQMGVNPCKIQVIPDAIPTECYGDDIAAPLPATLSWLPKEFALYPAQMWPHKNHLRLLDAIALNRDRHGVTIPMICTGRKNEHWPAIQRRMAQLHLQHQVHFVGYVEPSTLRALYARALFMAMPTLHESVSYPVFEAFAAGVPVACSAVTSLPEQCAGAALLFDPLDVNAIAHALRALTQDGGLRARLSATGRTRAKLFSIQRTACAYRALYRRVAGFPLSPIDRELLSDNWMAINEGM